MRILSSPSSSLVHFPDLQLSSTKVRGRRIQPRNFLTRIVSGEATQKGRELDVAGREDGLLARHAVITCCLEQ
ncbi:unnamed protein product [Litomosoides sigmodontis]|uniref:Uncharacterized protein n=1 Tax=Litomosoides sigmodontis TaxID=42156 RepID=A0A3P6SSW6_LITSI|nr:unnamed protein product [Litomosoides sigmodontis]